VSSSRVQIFPPPQAERVHCRPLAWPSNLAV
jgi:hypothetical protein